MVMKCYNKPNRKNPRVFTANDVARISRYAIDDGASALQILAFVAISTGFGYVFCRAAKAVDTATSVSRVIVRIAGVLAASKLVDFLLTVVTRGAFSRLPVINRIAAAVILAVGVSEGVYKLAKDFIDDESMVVEFSDLTHELCSIVKARIISGGETITDVYDDIVDKFD